MESGLLYLFTTVAQCLAAAIALLAAFTLFRLQTIQSAMASLAEGIIAPMRTNMFASLARELEDFVAKGGYGDVVERVVNDGRIQNSALLLQLKNRTTERPVIMAALHKALISTAVVTAGSIIGLPLAHLIKCSAPLSWFVAGADILGVGICFWYYRALIRSTLLPLEG